MGASFSIFSARSEVNILRIDRVAVATIEPHHQEEKEEKEERSIQGDGSPGEGDHEQSQKNDGQEEPKWSLLCWMFCKGGTEICTSIKNIYGACVGPMNKILRNWDEDCFETYRNCKGDRETKLLTIKSSDQEKVSDSSTSLCPQFSTASHASRQNLRSRRAKVDNQEFRNMKFDRRKKPTFSPTKRQIEAKDYKESKRRRHVYPRNSLMGLPAELRLVILESLFEDLEIDAGRHMPLVSARYGPGQPAGDYLAILRTCRELYFEGHKIFQQHTTFSAHLVVPNVQTFLPNVKKVHLEIPNLESSLYSPNIIIARIDNSYKRALNQMMVGQAEEVFRDGNKLNILTVDLEKGTGRSRVICDYLMKKYAIDSLIAFRGGVKRLRITGEIPDLLKKPARNMEVLVQGYDDDPKPEGAEEESRVEEARVDGGEEARIEEGEEM